MGEHKRSILRICARCGAQEIACASAMAAHVCPTGTRGGQARVWRRQGRCTRCGKKCLPYALCDSHRFAARLTYALRRGVKYGLFKSPKRGYYEMGDEHAKVGQRGWYTSAGGRAPRGFFSYAEALLRQRGTPMTEAAIIDNFTAYRRDRAARGHLESSGPVAQETTA